MSRIRDLVARLESALDRLERLELKFEQVRAGTDLPLIRSDQIRSDQIRSDQISDEKDQIRSDQIRSDQIAIPCQDGSAYLVDTASYRARFVELDVDAHFADLLARIARKPSIAPRSRSSAKKWCDKTVETAARSQAARALSEKVEAAEAAELLALREVPRPVFEMSPLAERLRALEKEKSCPTSSASGDRGSVSR